MSWLNKFKKGEGSSKKEKEKGGSEKSAKKSGKTSKKGKYQKKSPLSYTAREPFVESLFGDGGFTHDYDGELYGVVLILPFDQIGGLTNSKADKSNQNKGRFTVSVNKGDLEVYYDEALDEAEKLAILVNTENVDTLYDFSILKEADFTWAYFPRDESEEIVETEYVSTLEELYDHRTDLKDYFLSIFDLMKEEEEAEKEAAEEASESKARVLDELGNLSGLGGTQAETTAETVADEQSETIDEPEFTSTKSASNNNVVAFGGMTATNVEEDAPFADFETVPVSQSSDDEADEYDDLRYDEDLMDQNDNVDEEAVDAVLEQVLFKDDLDLVAPTNRFREIYFQDASRYFIQHYEADDSWLTAEVNKLITAANQDIKRRIVLDDDQIHGRFNKLLSDLAIKTASEFSLESKHYAELMSTALDVKRENKSLSDSDVNEFEAKLTAAYNEARERKGDEAKTNAMNAYDAQHHDRHVRQIEEYKDKSARKLESEYNSSVIQIKEQRKVDANQFFEVGVTKILSELGRRYSDIRESQSELAKEWNQRILDFIDENRANDIAKAEVLRQQLESDERFAQLENESKSRIAQLTEEFESRISLIQTGADVDIERLSSRIQTLESEKDKLIRDYNHLESKTSADYETLSERYHAVNQELIEAKSKANLAEMQQQQLGQREREVEDWKTQVDIVSKANERNKIAFVCLASLAIVGALLMGMIFGAQLF